MNPKDLLDFDKVTEFEKQVAQEIKDLGLDLKGLSEDDAIEREHEPVEYYVEPELPSEHNL